MLAWKWWRDCRGRAFVYWGAALALGVLTAVDATTFRWWMEQFRHDPQRVNFYLYLTWSRIGYNLAALAWLGAVWMGLALAISSLGRDYASPAAAFLLTRPRSRTAMLWTDWAMTQGTVVVAAAMLLGSASVVAGRALPLIHAEDLWVWFPTAIAVAIAVYGLALFWTAATRSAVRGVELAIATMLVLSWSPAALLEWWHIAWPDRAQSWMLRIFEWRPVYSYWIENPFRPRAGAHVADNYLKPVMYQSLEPYPLGALVMWIGLGLALTYATQKMMERREV